MMKAVAYIRVSTSKDEQALSLKNQREYFEDYVGKRGDELVKIYCDEGKSATKSKNRPELQELIKDAKKGLYNKIYAKDISRMFRNQLDFLNFVRDLLDTYGIVLHLVNLGEGRDLDSFTLSLMALIADNESRKISERIKFGKEISKKKGIVPNFVFGYDRVDKYNLLPNAEAEWVKKIYCLYTEENLGMSRIADFLYKNKVKTKKLKDGEPNFNWSQHTVSSILKNRIYTGFVINNKQNIKSIYTGERITMDTEDWFVVERPEFRIISDEQFDKAQQLIITNAEVFPSDENGHRRMSRRSEAHILSNLLKCDVCGNGYRRYQRKHCETGPMYYWWVCSKRHAYGSARCKAPSIRVEEEDVLSSLSLLFDCLIQDRESFFKLLESKASALIKEHVNQIIGIDLGVAEKELKALQSERERIKTMVKKGYLDMDEGGIDLKRLDVEIQKLSTIINSKDVTSELTRKVKESIKEFSKTFDAMSFKDGLTNNGLRGVIKEIKVISKVELHVYFKVQEEVHGICFPIRIEEKSDNTTDTDCEFRT